MLAFEGISTMWTVGILSFLLGLSLGCIAAYFVFSRTRKTRQLQSELDEFKERFTDYRDTVTEHFMQTSSLVQEMTKSYRAVYEHLASGAQHLCNIDPVANHLSRKKTEEIVTPQAASAIAAETALDEDDLAELSSIRNDIDQLMGESPRVPDINTKAGKEEKSPLPH